MEEMVGNIGGQLSNIIEQLQQVNQRLDQQEERFTKMEELLRASQAENKALKEDSLNKDHEIKQLKSKLNDVEMHQRSFNIRIFNFHLEGESNDTRNVMNQVYEKILKPVLEGAVSKGRLAAVPTVDSLLETAHILPGKEGKPKPIICRFFNRFHRMLFLQLKKEFAPRGQPKSPSRSPPYLYPVYEDVSKDMFRLMRALASHTLVDSCWAAGGVLKIKMADSNVVQRISNIYDTVDEIIDSLK
jgi:hypothetical protein